MGIHERSIGIDARLWVLATPVDGSLIDLVLVSQMREMRKPKRPIVGLRFVPLSLRARIMNQIIGNPVKTVHPTAAPSTEMHHNEEGTFFMSHKLPGGIK